jgi:hypothetical protein
LNIKIISGLEPFFLENENITLKVYGDLIGHIEGSEFYSTQHTLELLSKIQEPKEIEDILFKTIGSFFILIESSNGSRCYSSLVHNGFYYSLDTKNNLINISEEEFSLVESDDIVRDNAIKRIGKVNPGLHRFPLSSLFEKIDRCPAGAFIEISETIVLKNYLNKIFLSDSVSKKNILSTDLLEERLGLILKAYKDFYGKISLFMSGGIDSSVLMAVLQKNKIDSKNYFIPYSGLGSNNHKIVEYVTGNLGAKLNLVEEDDLPKLEQIEDLLRRSKSGPGSLLGLMYSKYYQKKNIEDRIVVTGQNLDSMYHIDTFAPNTEYTGLYRMLVILKSSLLRLRYTSINVIFMNFKSLLYGNPTHKYSVFEDTLNSDLEHVKVNQEHNIDTDYERTKENETLKLLDFLEVDMSSDLTHKSQNELFKKIKFFRFVQNTYSNYFSLRTAENIKRINPYGEAPILLALISYRIPLSSLFSIKKHSHNLFKKIHKSHHNKLVRAALNYNAYNDLSSVLQYFVRKFAKKDDKNKKDFSPHIVEVFHNLNPSISMNDINLSKNDQKYVEEVLGFIDAGPIDEKLGDEIIRILGTLVYLTHCYKKE